MNSKTFNEKLIKLVKDSPSLYNKKSSEYKDNVKKENDWNKIAQSLGVSGECIVI